MPIAPGTSIGLRPHLATFSLPGESVPDGEGGYTDGDPVAIGEAYVRIQPATGADAERVSAGTVLSHTSYIVTGPYLAGITTRATMAFVDVDGRPRTLNVMGVTNRDERGAEMVLVCDEVVP